MRNNSENSAKDRAPLDEENQKTSLEAKALTPAPLKSSFLDEQKIDTTILRTAQTEEQKLEVYRLRYHIYVEEMHRSCKADHDSKMIRDHLDDTGVLTVAYRDHRLVGTCRTNFSDNCQFENRDLYRFDEFEAKFPKGVMFTTKLMVLPEFRKGSLFIRIAKHMFEEGLKRGAIVTIIDCNEHLVSSFQRMGFKEYAGQAHHPEYGAVTPMVLYNYDVQYMQSIRSPLLPVIRKHIAANTVAADIFKEKSNEL